MLLDREEGTGLDGEAQVAGIDCVRPLLEVSAVNAAGARSRLLGLDPLEGGIVALEVPFVP